MKKISELVFAFCMAVVMSGTAVLVGAVIVGQVPAEFGWSLFVGMILAGLFVGAVGWFVERMRK